MWPRLTDGQVRAFLRDGEVTEALESCGVERLATDVDAVFEEEWDAVVEEFGLDDSFQYTPEQALDYINASRILAAIPEAVLAADRPTYMTPLRERSAA